MSPISCFASRICILLIEQRSPLLRSQHIRSCTRNREHDLRLVLCCRENDFHFVNTSHVHFFRAKSPQSSLTAIAKGRSTSREYNTQNAQVPSRSKQITGRHTRFPFYTHDRLKPSQAPALVSVAEVSDSNIKPCRDSSPRLQDTAKQTSMPSTVMSRSSLCALISSFVLVAAGLSLPPPTGPYNVGSKPYVLDHLTVNDPVAPNGTATSILVNIYYPTRDTAPSQEYLWAGLTGAYETYYAIPAGTFNITANIAYDAAPLSVPECEALKLPTLFFGPAAIGPPSQVFFGLISELVSKGYVVVTVDHPWEPPYLEYPDGTAFVGHDPAWFPEGDGIVRIHEYRIADNSAVLDALPTISEKLDVPLNQTHFVFFGHSLGGSVALSQILAEKNRTESKDKTFLGALNIDGTNFGTASTNDSSADLNLPSLLLASSGHLPENDPTWPVFESHQTSWTKGLRILGNSNHSDYSDLIFLKQAIGIGGGEGAITGSRLLEVSRKFVADFFAFVNGGGEGVLVGDGTVQVEWPEVAFDYNGTGDPCANQLYWAPEGDA